MQTTAQRKLYLRAVIERIEIVNLEGLVTHPRLKRPSGRIVLSVPGEVPLGCTCTGAFDSIPSGIDAMPGIKSIIAIDTKRAVRFVQTQLAVQIDAGRDGQAFRRISDRA